MKNLFYHSDAPHSDLGIKIIHSSMNSLGSLGMVSQPVLTYEISDSSGQSLTYSCDLGNKRLLAMSNEASLVNDDADALDFITKAHTAMIALGYNSIATDQGDEIDFEALNISLESIALAIAESNHLSGIQ